MEKTVKQRLMEFAEFRNLQLNYENLSYNYALYYYGELGSSGY